MENPSNSNGHDESDPNNNNGVEDKKKEKKYKPPKEDVPSVFPSPEERNKIIDHLPILKVKKFRKSPRVLTSIEGPYDMQYAHDVFIPYISGRSISTYPHIPGRPKRDGDPVCDSYSVQLLEDNIVVAVVADGCNWGKRPMEASNKAKSAFVEYMRGHLNDITYLRDIGHFLLSAISYCHYKIIEGKEDIWEAGTTTLLGGVVIPLHKTKEELKSEGKDVYKSVFVYVSIGDCKAYHFSKKDNCVYDITKGNRRNVYDARDSGGRLGPYVGEGNPDLRNIVTKYTICEEGDLILLVSDGVHDNLDPQTLGKSPKDIDSSYGDADWRDITNEELVENLKTEFMTKFLKEELVCGGEEERKMRQKVFSFSSFGDDDVLSPEKITNKIMHHCISVTGRGREWMEQNPKEKLPNDYVQYPGKMDHATCVTLKIAPYEKELLKLSGKSSGKSID